jgi:hypothetical protein
VLDHIACVGAVAIELHDLEAFDISVAGLNQVYNLPVGPQGFANVYPREASARIWLSVIQRACALGALAVRLQGWDAIAKLVSQRGQDRDFDYYYNWFRHALTMAARSELLHESRDGRQVSTTLISHALKTIDQVPCLRPDASPGDEAILNSLCQFDLLVSVATISQAYPKNDGDFYPNFARYYSERATPAARMLIVDSTLRSLLFPRDDHALASALRQVDSLARQEGARFNGWWGFRESGDRVVAKFLEDHPPSP